MTNLILLIGAGLFSKSIGNFERYKYNKLSVFSFGFLPSIVDANYCIGIFSGWAPMSTTPAATGQARTTSVETSGTLTVAAPRVDSVTKGGWSLVPSSDGRTTALSVSSILRALPFPFRSMGFLP